MKHVRPERGSAMVISLLVLLGLTTAGMAFMMQSKTETQIAGNQLRHAQTLSQAEAGIAEAMARLNMKNGPLAIKEPTVDTEPGWGRYLVSEVDASSRDQWRPSEKDGRDNNGDGVVDEPGERYPEVPSRIMRNGFDWVRVEFQRDASDSVYRFGDHDENPATPARINKSVGAPVLRIISEARVGNSRRTIEATAVRSVMPLITAAIYTENDNFKIQGSGSISGGAKAGISTTQDPSKISGKKSNLDGDPPQQKAPVDIDMEEMFATLTEAADIYLPSDPDLSTVPLGSADNPIVLHVDGDLHANSDQHGFGILLVNGDYHCNGKFQWSGMVMVMGDVTFNGSGHLTGSLYVRGTEFGEQKFTGNDHIDYDRAALDLVQRSLTLRVVRWREL